MALQGIAAPTAPRLSILAPALQWKLRWAYPTHEKRDLRLDLLRGFAVFMMVVDHFGGSSWLYLITGGNTFFTSGAEAFVFISGLIVGMVYGSIAVKEGLRKAQIKALLRALTLYKLAVVLTLVFAAYSLLFGLPWSRDLRIDNPVSFVIGVLSLRQTMYLADIPLMYSLLLLLTPLGLWLLVSKRASWLLAASALLWSAFQIFPSQAQFPWPIVGNTTFNLAAWQLLFFAAMVIGFHRSWLTRKLSHVPRWQYFILSAILLLGLIDLRGSLSALNEFFPGALPQNYMVELFKKEALAPGRLLASFIVFQFAYLLATLVWKPIYAVLGWVLLPLGQNSLYCYTMHVAVIGLFYAVLPYSPLDVLRMGTLNTALQILAVLLIWLMAQRQFLFRFVPR